MKRSTAAVVTFRKPAGTRVARNISTPFASLPNGRPWPSSSSAPM